jgi:hypothetical protein
VDRSSETNEQKSHTEISFPVPAKGTAAYVHDEGVYTDIFKTVLSVCPFSAVPEGNPSIRLYDFLKLTPTNSPHPI